MAQKKVYGSAAKYEKKLQSVMDRLGVEKYVFDWNRQDCYVEFWYKGELYRFDHSVEKARQRGIDLSYGSDAFAQVVLSLEDLARMVERGIYDLQVWVSGMRCLPQTDEIPDFFRFLGFDQIPDDMMEIIHRYRTLAKQMHPDVGGSAVDFAKLRAAFEQARQYVEKKQNQ